MWLKALISNHVLTNLLFGLVLVVGLATYLQLPREQDPTINFNWVQITTFYPGAAAKDVEKKVTDIIEEALEKVQDVKFVSSTSREAFSSILVRFQDIDEREFDQRLADLRREVNNIEDDLPTEIDRPAILEITTANAFPTATLVLSGPADDENLRRQASILERELSRIKGVDSVQPTGLRDPEIQIQFYPEKIEQLGISPVSIADTVQTFYRDISAGKKTISNDQWLVALEGTTLDLDEIAQWPILVNDDREIRIGDVANVVHVREKAERLVRYQGDPGVLFAVMKRANTNTLELVESIKAFIDERNQLADERGVILTLIDDQTEVTRSALQTMQTNALLGLVLVLIVTWLFLGAKISLLVTIGIPFTLAGTFIVLHLLGHTLNTSVLLAIVISLGMLVDDAVVVVESIHHQLRQNIKGLTAAWSGLVAVVKPVTASVLTTMAAFLPLMLLPGILGKFMLVIPLVVTLALAISLIEAYWMLPAHIYAANVHFDQPSKIDQIRQRWIRKVRSAYGKSLIKVLRHPKWTLFGLFLLFSLTVGIIQSGVIKKDFFASDALRLFYINIEMPPSTTLTQTMEKTVEIESLTRELLNRAEIRSIVSYAGQAFTETAPAFGDHLGQILVSLKPLKPGFMAVDEIIPLLEDSLSNVIGPTDLYFQMLAGGPPTSKAVSVKVRGDDFAALRSVTDRLTDFMRTDGRFVNIADDDSEGTQALILQLKSDSINQAGVNPAELQRVIKMMVDGEIVSTVQHQGDTVLVRVKASTQSAHDDQDIETLLSLTVPNRSGVPVPIGALVEYDVRNAKANIRHYNFMRTITLEADLANSDIDTITANQLIIDYWVSISDQFPSVNLDFTGELDDINESMSAMAVLFLFGLGLIYLILSTQFQSYFQPLMILATVPLAFIGVVMGLLVANIPLSLYTLYGVVALAGISVNAAIVLISTANDHLNRGAPVTFATFFAARRRMLPVAITTLTTVAGLFSLATGLGGQSMLWSPVATVIVWGLIFSSFLTLYVIPLLFQITMRSTNS